MTWTQPYLCCQPTPVTTRFTFSPKQFPTLPKLRSSLITRAKKQTKKESQDHERIQENSSTQQQLQQPEIRRTTQQEPIEVYQNLSSEFSVEGDIEVDWTPYGWGILTTKDLKDGDEIVQIALQNTICVMHQAEYADEAQQQFNLDFCKDFVVEMPKDLEQFMTDPDFSCTSRMIAFLMWLKNIDHPKWNKYIESWPAPEDCASIWLCNEDDYYHFEEPHFTKFVVDRRNDAVFMYEQYKECGMTYDCSLEYFLYLLHICSSRSHICVYKGVGASVLAPIFDFANHSNYPNAATMQRDENHLSIVAIQDIKQGEEVFISYGQTTNEDLIYHHGFLVPQNKYNRMDTRPSRVVIDGRLFGDMMKVSGKFNGSDLELQLDEGSWFSASTQDQADRAISAINSLPFIQFRRLVATQPESNEYFKEFKGALELAAYLQGYWQWAFETDLPSDMEYLESEEGYQLSPGSRLGLMYRIEQKQLIVDLLAVLLMYAQRLSEADDQLNQLIQFAGLEVQKAFGIYQEATEEEAQALLNEKDPFKLQQLERAAYDKGILASYVDPQ